MTQKWCSQTIEALSQATPAEILEDMLDHFIVDEGKALKIFIEEWKPQSFWCGLRGHIRATCKPQKTEELEKIKS